MQWRGVVLGVVGLLGLAQGGNGSQGPDQCSMQCGQVYSLHTAQYEQVLPSLQACQRGCHFFSRIESQNGFEDTLSNLENCNYSCDGQMEGALVPACQSGCGFHFDSDRNSQNNPPPPPSPPVFTRGPPPPPSPSVPTYPRARGPSYPRSQAPPRPTVFMAEKSPRMWPETPRSSMRSEMVVPPRTPMMRSNNPLINIFRSPGPVMLRPQTFNMTPQRAAPLMAGPPPPPSQGNLITKENPRGPTIIGFSLPQLISRVQSILPNVEKALPRVHQTIEKMPAMEIFSRKNQQDEPRPHGRSEESRPSLEFSLPSMEQVFARIGEVLPDMEERVEPIMNRVMEIEIENPFEEFEETPRMSILPRIPQGFFGMKDDDDFGFGGIFDQLTNHVMSSQFSQSWSPFGEPREAGKLTIIKAGPGFHEEQHFDIGPNGKLTEITESPMDNGGLDHENPMDVHFNSNDVEVFNPHNDNDMEAEIFEVTGEPIEEAKTEKTVVSEPVMDVWAIEEEEEEEQKKPEPSSQEEIKSVEETKLPVALPQVKDSEFSVKEFSAKEYPFLDVLRNTVEENERMSQQLLNRYRSLADREYRDDYTCNSDHLKWSDWVACLHARVGVPRWLTAATISLGIVFSVWLCLVIPTAAPKQRIRALVIRAEKPSAALAKAKEAEATVKACEAAGVDPNSVVSVVRVDLPPSYGDVRPASPAPSYKSEMGVPGSPAPSYRSVDIPAEKENKEDKVVLEPVHNEPNKSNKESVA